MRICRVKATKKILEVQSGGTTAEHLQTLLDNAVSAGFQLNEIEAIFMDGAEYAQALLDDPAVQADLADVAQKRTLKEQAILDALSGWRADLNAIEVKIDALSQPYRGIFKDILSRIRKNTRVLSWMAKGSDS